MATVPSEDTAAVGGKITAAWANSDIRDAINFLINVPRVRVTHSTTQSIPTASFTACLFDTEVFDTDSMHSTSSNTSRFTAVTAGLYEVAGMIAWAGSSTGRRGGAFYKNGSIIAGTEVLQYASGTGSIALPMSDTSIYLGVGDYIEMMAYQDSGGALNANVGGGAFSAFEARWVASS